MLFGAFWLALFSFTTLQNLLPARLGPDLRDKYIAMSVHLDSLERAVQTFDGYTQNITSLFDDTSRIATVSMPAGAGSCRSVCGLFIGVFGRGKAICTQV